MIRNISLMLVAAFLSVVANPAAAEDNPALRTAAENHIRHPVTQHALDGILSIDTLRSHLVFASQASGTQLESDEVEALEALTRSLKEEFDRIRPELETLMVNAAIDTYTLDELQALNEFYDTAAGASAMMKAHIFTQSFSVGVVPLVQQMFTKLNAQSEAQIAK